MHIPNEIIYEIYTFVSLNPKEWLNFQLVCKQFADIIYLGNMNFKHVSKMSDSALCSLNCKINQDINRPEKTVVNHYTFDPSIKQSDSVVDILYKDKHLLMNFKYLYKFNWSFGDTYLIYHPERFSYIILTNFEIQCECLSCDGTTTSSVTIYEERSLTDLIDTHLTNEEFMEIKQKK